MATVSPSPVPLKQCTKCKMSLAISCFYIKDKKTGRRYSWCNLCHNKMTRKWRKRNPEKHLALCIAWQKANPEKVRESHRRSIEKNRDKINDRAREYARKHRDVLLVRRAAYRAANPQAAANYRAANATAIKTYNRAYRQKNAKKQAAAQAKCREKNPDLYRDIAKSCRERRRVRKLGNGPVEQFRHSEIFERDNWKCHLCGGAVNRSLQYPDPMSASLDHITPLAKGGSHERTNVACSHLKCNLIKRDRYERPSAA